MHRSTFACRPCLHTSVHIYMSQHRSLLHTMHGLTPPAANQPCLLPHSLVNTPVALLGCCSEEWREHWLTVLYAGEVGYHCSIALHSESCMYVSTRGLHRVSCCADSRQFEDRGMYAQVHICLHTLPAYICSHSHVPAQKFATYGRPFQKRGVAGCKHGLAKFFYANGDVFMGKLDSNRRESLGTLYMVSGTLTCSMQNSKN